MATTPGQKQDCVPDLLRGKDVLEVNNNDNNNNTNNYSDNNDNNNNNDDDNDDNTCVYIYIYYGITQYNMVYYDIL